eukprot:scaffold57_cov254-Pinguiococcus_pyrenoidosus.AAC.33
MARWLLSRLVFVLCPLVRSSSDRIIYFLHLHKAGGSYVCALAGKNGARHTPTDNCNVYVSAAGAQVARAMGHPCCGDTVAAQRSFAAKSSLTFVANEFDLAPEMDVDSFVYVTQLRPPLERYVSHFMHVSRAFSRSFDFDDWLLRQPDNWYLRKLCGRQCSEVPRGRLDQSHYEIAKGKLEKFEVVLLLEDHAGNNVLFEAVLGWMQHPESKVNAAPASQTVNGTQHKDALVERAKNKKFEDMVAWDALLYYYAEYLHYQQVGKARSWQEYSERNKECTGPCCSTACSQYR